jgi:uncharacterized glyoxalase superfamily protein PhnB
MTASEILRIAVTVGTIQLICDWIAYWRVYSKEHYDRALGAYSRAEWKKQKATKDHNDQLTKVAEAKAAAIAAEAAASTKQSGKTSVVSGAISNSSASKLSKTTKALERADADHADAASNVARHHSTPTMLTSILFLLLMRILGTEYSGKIIGLLPFTPFGFFRRLITMRGLKFVNGEEALNMSFIRASSQEEATKKPEEVFVTQACSFLLIYLLSTVSVKFYVNKLFGTAAPPGADSIMAMAHSTWGRKALAKMGIDHNDLKME